MSIKKRKVLQRRNCCCHQTTIYYDTTLNVRKSSPASFTLTLTCSLTRTHTNIYAHTYKHTFTHLNIIQRGYNFYVPRAYTGLRVLVCLFYVRVRVLPSYTMFPKGLPYSLVNEEKLLFSLGLIILFKHPVVSSGSCTSTTVCIC